MVSRGAAAVEPISHSQEWLHNIKIADHEMHCFFKLHRISRSFPISHRKDRCFTLAMAISAEVMSS